MSVCDNIMFLKVVYFIRVLLDVVLFIVPMGLIVMIILDFSKNVIAGKEDEMRKNLNLVIKRLIYAVILFLVPTVVEFAISLVDEDNGFVDCFYVTKDDINSKLLAQEAKCVSKGKRWSDVSYSCIEKTDYYVDTSIDHYGGLVKNFSSSKASIANGGSFVHYTQIDDRWGEHPYCASSGDNIYWTGCGATSLAIMASTFIDKKYTPDKVGDFLCNNGHKGGATPRDLLKNTEVINKLELDVEVLFESPAKYNLGNAGTEYKKDRGLSILNAVNEGKGIILYIPNHYIAVTPNEKCSSDEVFIQDVAGRVSNQCLSVKKLWEKTYNYNNKCTDEKNCGWKSAYAYSKKS